MFCFHGNQHVYLFVCTYSAYLFLDVTCVDGLKNFVPQIELQRGFISVCSEKKLPKFGFACLSVCHFLLLLLLFALFS